MIQQMIHQQQSDNGKEPKNIYEKKMLGTRIDKAYQFYPYKKWVQDTTKSYLTVPYVTKEERTNTPFSLFYNEWKKILKVWQEEVIKEILDGHVVPAYYLGTIGLYKYKRRFKKVNWGETKKRYGIQKGKEEKRFVTSNYISTDNYLPILLFSFENRTVIEARKINIWYIWMSIKMMRMINPNIIDNLPDVKSAASKMVARRYKRRDNATIHRT